MDALDFNTKRYTNSVFGFADHVRAFKIVQLTGLNGTVLDLGCLDGTMGELLKKNGNTVYGIDASSKAVTLAKEKGVNAQVGNLEERLNFSNNSFDVVVAGEILEHIFRLDELLSEVSRVLKPAGFLVASTPNLASLGRRLMLLFNINPNIEISFSGEAAGHIRYFVKSTLFDAIEKHNFEIVSFTSDIINLNSSGSARLVRLAEFIPTLGRTLIVKARKK